MFIAPMLWKKIYGAILGQRRANMCRRQCNVLLRIVNSDADATRRRTVREYEVSTMIGSNPPPTDTAAAREARVLLVDDDRELCQMLSEYLDAEHFDVKSVHDGGDALAELQANRL